MPPLNDMDDERDRPPRGSRSRCEPGPASPPPTPPRPQHSPAKAEGTEAAAHRRGSLVRLASSELEAMRSPPPPPPSSPPSGRGSRPSSPSSSASRRGSPPPEGDNAEEAQRTFPPACLRLLRSLPGNARCHDCADPAAPPEWASVGHGCVLCLSCAGRHRSLGVGTSFVKSLSMDAWCRREILCMLEGGNGQLGGFFERHGMGAEAGVVGAKEGRGGLDRYRTKAASFYRQHLLSHARRLAEGGAYEGREASRAAAKGSPKQRRSPKKASSPKRTRRLPAVAEKEAAEVERPSCTVGA